MSNNTSNSTSMYCVCGGTTTNHNTGCNRATGNCGPCVPRCHWDVDTYQDIVDSRAKYAGSYVTVRDEGNAVYHLDSEGAILEIWRPVIEEPGFIPTVGAYKKTTVINKDNSKMYVFLADGTYLEFTGTYVS